MQLCNECGKQVYKIRRRYVDGSERCYPACSTRFENRLAENAERLFELANMVADSPVIVAGVECSPHDAIMFGDLRDRADAILKVINGGEG